MNGEVRVFGRILFLFILLPALSAAAADAANPALDPAIYGHVVHIGWVVRDIDRVQNYWANLGVRKVQLPRVEESSDAIYRGKKSPMSMRMAFGNIGGVPLEWIEPVKGESHLTEFLQKHGDGVHHIAYAVPSAERLGKEIAYFKSKGVGTVQEGSWKGAKGEGRFVYLDTAPQGGGITLELLYDPDASTAPAPQSQNEYPFNKIVQYAFVVRDVRKVGDYYERLGFGKMDIEHNVSVDRNYRGKPANFEMYLGWGRSADVVFEWIQSIVGPSVYNEYLKAHGEGFHHLAFDVNDMDEAVKLLARKGAPVSQSGGWDSPGSKGRFAYMDSEPYGGVTIELLWNQP